MKVLIVEDNPKMRRMIADFIADKFEEIYECADGDEAFALYKEHHPDWVLMDWNMPKKDGITATREIMSEFPKARICMVTTFDNEDLRSEALAVGASGFVLKKKLFDLETIFKNHYTP